MEFNEMKKVWDSQNNEHVYAINENALHNRIRSKLNRGQYITNISELLSIVVNIGVGAFFLVVNLSRQTGNVFMYVLASWMFVTALILIISRIRRIKGDNQFDRSMRSDLDYALSMATYQVHLSRLLRWNTLPVGVLMILAVWEAGNSVWFALGLLAFFVLVNYAAGWEHGLYKTRKDELANLKEKLENEN